MEQVQTLILLNGANYERWSKLMMNSLRTKRKLEFIDGTLKRPTSDPDAAEKWDMVNSMIIGWIYSIVEVKLRPSISLVSSVKAMWASLQRHFLVSDDTRIHQLLADISTCKQDGDTVEIFFGKIKVMWDDLADLDTCFTCCCGDAECSSMVKYEKNQEKIRVHQFLMGLDNSRFVTTCSNLLSRQTYLSLDTVYSQIIQEERHLNVMRGTAVVGLSATTSTLPASMPRFNPTQAVTSRNTRSSSTCIHCEKSGHESTNYFQIIGFPEWWIKKTHSGEKGGGRGHGAESGRGHDGRGSGFRAYNAIGGDAINITDQQQAGISNFSQYQWASLASFLYNQKQPQDSSNKLSDKKDKMFLFGNNARYYMIIDSCAFHHMMGDITLLTNVLSIASCPIKLPNGKFTWASKHGSLKLGNRLVLNNVFYAPHLLVTVISVAQLLGEVAEFELFTKKFCVIQDLASKTLIGMGKERDGVYHYAGDIKVQAGHVQSLNTQDV